MLNKLICNRYKIISHLGTGGMATVWLAEDIILNRKVAVKTFNINSDDEEAIKRFNREANAVTSLYHKNIVSIYDVQNEGNFYYLILEYVEGQTLKDYMSENPNIPIEKAINIMTQIASGLSEAHKNGIIHRDIKPQNILMTKDLTCKITDFGISRAYGDTTLTQTNQMLGTVYYLSPEQARGNVATAQSDIYSFGILMFELITGRIPFKGESPVAIALKHLREPLPEISKYRNDVPQSVKNIIKKATMKNPNERYISSKELKNDLETCLNADRINENSYFGFDSLENDSDSYEKTSIKNMNLDDGDNQNLLRKQNENDNIKKNKNANKKRLSKKAKVSLSIIILLLIAILSYFSYNYYLKSNILVPDLKNMTVEEAEKKLKKLDLKLGEVTETPSDDVDENEIISSDPAAGKKVKKGTEINVKVSSGRNTISMPNYVGMTEEQVKKSVEDIGFKNVTFEKSESDEYEEGKVMHQSIDAGEKVTPKKTNLIIKISTGSKAISVPNFVGKDLNDAYVIAEKLGIQIKVGSSEYNSEYKQNQIIDQNPEKNSKIKKGDSVTVTLSKGEDPNKSSVNVKNFSNQDFKLIKDWAHDNNINLSISYEKNSNYSKNIVISQNPNTGMLKKGSTITVVVAK